MAGITLDQAQAQLDAYLAASTAVANGQSYQIGTRAFRRADLKEILVSIKFWDGKVAELTAGGIRVRRGIVVDR